MLNGKLIIDKLNGGSNAPLYNMTNIVTEFGNKLWKDFMREIMNTCYTCNTTYDFTVYSKCQHCMDIEQEKRRIK
tara:strand:+ start:440 stop:664 length:225 start_codon:yes stop_codon:yes gene_type:complete